MTDEEIEKRKNENRKRDSKDSWFYSKIDGIYTWLLQFSMAHRWVIVVLCVLVF